MLRDILALIDGEAPAGPPLDAAVALARLHNAHLGVTVLSERLLMFNDFDTMGLQYLDNDIDERHRARLADVRLAVADAPIWVDVRGFCEDPAALPWFANVEGRHADVVLIAAADGWANRGVRRRVVEGCLLGARAPVLLVPSSWRPAPIRHAVLGWNGSAEAAQAARALIAVAEPGARIDVAVVDGEAALTPGGRIPGSDIARHLACHGLIAETAPLTSTDGHVATRLTQAALESGADLLALGGYGHSRFREIMLGGVTRALIETQPLPILMAH